MRRASYLSELPDEFELPVAHAEGRFVGVLDDAKTYVANGRAALLYTSDINGSSSRIAGLQDATGRVFGLMPHPERFVNQEHTLRPRLERCGARLGLLHVQVRP